MKFLQYILFLFVAGLLLPCAVNAADSYVPDTVYMLHYFAKDYVSSYLYSADGERVLFNDITGIYDRIPILPIQWQGESQYAVAFKRALNFQLIQPYLIDYARPYGIYLKNSPAAYCEENIVRRYEMGAYMDNSGRESISRMYRNNFGRQPEGDRSTDMEGGTMVLRINSDSNLAARPGRTGLQVRCNEYTGIGSAIDVSGNMRLNQGTNDDRKVEPAGNQFHTTFVNGMELNAPNTNENYNYYQTLNYTANAGFHTELERYYGTEPRLLLNLNTIGIYCQSNYGLHIIYNDHVLRIDTVKLVVNRLEFTYDSIVDRGNTNMMLAQIATVSLFNMSGPLSTLSNGGYLSDTVFSALLASNAPAAFKSAVLVANSPLPRKIRTMVENSNLSSTYKQIIAALQIGTSARERLQYKIDDGYQEIAVLESEIFHEAVNNDTVTAVRDTAIGYFHGKLDYTYKDLIYVYKLQLSKQDYSSARGTLKDIYGMTTGMEQDLRDEVTTFCSVNEIYLDFLTAASEAQAVKVLEDNSTTLLSAVDDESPLYSGLAEILYERFADGEFLEYTPLPEMVISNKSMIVSKEPDTTLFVPYLTIYPNPTDGMAFVEYNFEYTEENGIEFLLDVLGKPHIENCNKGTLNLYSSDSRILHTMQLNHSTGLYGIDFSSCPAGTYIVEVLDCIGNTSRLKVVKY